MKKVVLTGGPCSGKSTVMRALAEEFGDTVVLVPEAATILLAGGFPVPGKHLPWSEDWQAHIQPAIVSVQQALEGAYLLVAQERGAALMVCDRGLLDGAAYTPGGLDEFCRRHAVDANQAAARYHAVIHLESLAVADPEKYGAAGNASRFETLEEAQRLEHATREAWSNHPTRHIIENRKGFVSTAAEVFRILRLLLSEPAPP